MTDTALATPLVERCHAFLVRFDDLFGYQLHVVHRGEVLVDTASGTDAFDRPIERDSLFAVYCATKPVAAIVTAAIVAQGLLAFDAPVRQFVPETDASFDRVRIHHLLTHTAGLHGYRAADYLLLPPDLRRFAATRSRPHPDWPIGTRTAYGEFVAWFLLCLAVESAAGQPFAELVGHHVARWLAAPQDLWVGAPDAAYDHLAPRLRVGIDVSFDRPVPMLLEVSRRFLTEPQPAPVGGLCSARGLGAFYQSLLDAHAGRAEGPIAGDVLRKMLQEPIDRADRAVDPVLGRSAGFGMGFMVDLSTHHFGARCSPASFGHGGLAANAWGFADPTHELVVAYIQTGRFAAERAVHAVREPLVDLIYDQLVPA